MKFLSQLCLLLFVVPYFGKQLYPDFFGAWYIQWTSAGLLSLLLPYGFTKSILTVADSKFSGGFLFIFVISVFLNGTGITLLNSTNSFLRVTEQTKLMPENISLEALNNKDPEKRKVVAQFIYKESGQPITYKDQLG